MRRARVDDSRGGFTLLELILTIAIVVLLGLLVAPKIMDAYPRVAAESEGIRLRADIAYAQQLAISAGKTHRVTFDSACERIIIRRAEGAGFVTVSQRDLANGVDLVGSTFSGGCVEFNLLGEPSEGGTATLKGTDGSTVTVTVTPGTGLVTVDSGGKEL